MTQNANGTQGTQEQGTQEQGTQGGMAAVLAAAMAQGAQAAKAPKTSRSNRLRYGVFVTVPEKHGVLVRYDVQTGKELASWWLLGADGTWALQMRTKKAALAWLDANGGKDGSDAATQKVEALKLAGGAAKALAVAKAAHAEVLAYAELAKAAEARASK